MLRVLKLLCLIIVLRAGTASGEGDFPFITPQVETGRSGATSGQIAQTLTVKASEVWGPMRNRNGFIHGDDGTIALNDSMISFLRPEHWRLFKPQPYEDALAQGAAITLIPADHYAFYKGGYPNAKPWLDWDEYEGYMLTVLEAYEALFPGQPPAYLDVWNEPDHPYFWSGTYEQLVETFARTINLFRSYNPDIKVVGPSISWYRHDGFGEENIIQLLADLDSIHGLRLDAISWHENGGLPTYGPGRPEHVYFDTENIRADVGAYFPPDYTPEYHINEYTGGRVHLSPGWTFAYMFWLDYMDIDYNSRSCWTVQEGMPPNHMFCGNCWVGLNGLFMSDAITPQPIYWVHRIYAEMEGYSQLGIGSTNANFLPMAVRDDTTETIRIMAGRYYDSTATSVTVNIIDYPYNHNHVLIDVQRIPSAAQFHWDPPVAMALPDGPIPAGTVAAPVVDGSIDYTFAEFNPGDVYILDVRPAICGDNNADGVINLADIVLLTQYVFSAGQAPLPPEVGDLDCSGVFNVLDAVRLIDHVFRGIVTSCDPCT